VPTLKGGSTVGIPSSPAVWVVETGDIGVLDIRDAERLQGFPENWTAPAVDDPTRRNGPRWKLVGNAVSVPVAEWLGGRLRVPGFYDSSRDKQLKHRSKWPRAAWSLNGSGPHESAVSEWPVRRPVPPLLDFLKYSLTPLSHRATAGFYSRTQRSGLKVHGKFIRAIQAHLKRMSLDSAA
jgi:DNA (cytosine-5)-methyltransferase 1